MKLIPIDITGKVEYDKFSIFLCEADYGHIFVSYCFHNEQYGYYVDANGDGDYISIVNLHQMYRIERS